MKKLLIISFGLLQVAQAAQAQVLKTKIPGNTRHVIYDDRLAPQFEEWEKSPKMHAVPPQYNNEHALIILQSERRDFVFEGTGITTYKTQHKIIKVLDKMGIEEFNDVVIPYVAGKLRCDSIKVRTISPDGIVKNYDYNKLYLSDGGFYIPIEGMVKNTEIEILINYKMGLTSFDAINFQEDFPILNATFEMNYPKELFFNFKGYHGFPVEEEKVVGGHKQMKIYKADIPVLKKQPYSFYDLYKMRIEYGLDHYTNRGGYQRSDNFTYNMLAKETYTKFYLVSKNDKKVIDKFLTSIGINGGETTAERIRKIEDGIKENISLYNAKIGDKQDNLEKIINNKIATSTGIVKLFAACFLQTGVNHEIGLVGSRFHHTYDPSFTNLAPFNDYVFFFPATGSYLAPTEFYFRHPEIPSDYVNSTGIFCKTNPEKGFAVGRENIVGEAQLRRIEALPESHNTVSNHAQIHVDKDFNATVDYTRKFWGYPALELRKSLANANNDEKKKIVLGKSLLAEKPEMMGKYSVKNENLTDVYQNKPVTIDYVVNSAPLFEKAGDNYILKIGKVIGTQTNFYANEERVLPVDLPYAHMNKFSISFHLPEGYKVKDVENLQKSVEQYDKTEGNTIAYFKSDCKVAGDNLVVTITESYPQVHYSVSDFEIFKKIMNSAADFYGASVVLEPAKTKKIAKPKHKLVAKATQAKHNM